MNLPLITPRAVDYMALVERGLNTNVLMAAHYGVVTSVPYAIMKGLVRDKLMTGKKRRLKGAAKSEWVYKLTAKGINKEYEVTAFDKRRPPKKPEAEPVETRVCDAFDFYIYPFARNHVAEAAGEAEEMEAVA